MDFLNQNIILYILAYTIGSIPFGYLLAKKYANIDVKNAGSGNIGATNVLRVVKEKDPKLAKKLGATTLLLDILKGALIVLLAKILGAPVEVQWTVAVLAVVGHCFSMFNYFDGGKGVATGLGVLLVMLPIPTLIGAAVWVIVSKVFKMVSLASLLGLIALVVSSYILYPQLPVIKTHLPLLMIAFIIIYKHIPNIIRIIKKEESTVL